MSEYKEVFKAVNHRLQKQSEQLEEFYRENSYLSKENKQLKNEIKALRADLEELSKEWQLLKHK